MCFARHAPATYGNPETVLRPCIDIAWGRVLATLPLLMALAAPSYGGVVTEEYLDRKGAICEPQLLQRRVAESLGLRQDFLKAVESNSVLLQMENSTCSGTYITPTCVLTAGHCLIDQPRNAEIKVWNGYRITKGGRGYVDPHYHSDRGIGKVTGDDIGLVVFDRPYEDFNEVWLSSVKGNLQLWFYEADKQDSDYGGSLARFDNGHWRDLGHLGLTGYTSQETGKPFRICSDSAFEWAPCFLYEEGDRTPKFETGVLCTTGEMGGGMSGGSFYNENSIFGVLVEGPGPGPNGWRGGGHVKIKNHWWYRHPRSYFSSNLLKGFANRVKVLVEADRNFILAHCPSAKFRPLQSSMGRRVRDPELVANKATNRFWLTGGTDVWRRLRFQDRMIRINRPLAIGDDGEFVIRLQRRLKALRYISFDPDGHFSRRTEHAIRRFQSDSGLPATGKADKQTIKALGLWFDRTN